MVAGRTAAHAGPSPVRRWVEENKNKLPRTYDELISYPMDYRREIYAELSPGEKSKMWTEQLTPYPSQHSDLTSDQTAILNEEIKLASDKSTFMGALRDSGRDHLQRPAQAAFGATEASLIFATLGPVDSKGNSGFVVPNAWSYTCATGYDWCDNGMRCVSANCVTHRGCGGLWIRTCDGLCRNP